MALTRGELQRLAEARLEDSELLLQFRRASASYYVGGYAAECALKACIAKGVREHEFPDRDRVMKSWTHRLEQLLGVAGLEDRLRRDAAINPALEASWDLVSKWTENARYRETSLRDARDFHTALPHPSYGVMQWLRDIW